MGVFGIIMPNRAVIFLLRLLSGGHVRNVSESLCRILYQIPTGIADSATEVKKIST